jgi:hypothetical protein
MVMKTLKEKAKATKDFVYKHRVAIAVTITAAMAVKWNYNTAKQFNDFLRAHGLYDEFYAQVEEEQQAS